MKHDAFCDFCYCCGQPIEETDDVYSMVDDEGLKWLAHVACAEAMDTFEKEPPRADRVH